MTRAIELQTRPIGNDGSGVMGANAQNLENPGTTVSRTIQVRLVVLQALYIDCVSINYMLIASTLSHRDGTGAHSVTETQTLD